jgi:hypothetical protein
MFNENSSGFEMFTITTVSTSPTVKTYIRGVPGSKDYKSSYHTDYTTSFVYINIYTVDGLGTKVNLYFVDSYTTISQKIYVYQTSASSTLSPSTNEEHLIFDMSMHSASALKVSFSLIIDTTSTYNLFIMRVGPSNTSIIRYRY